MLEIIGKINLLLEKKDKRNLILLAFFSLFIAFIETVAISSIMPFIDLASNFEQIHSNKYYSYFYNLFSFENDISFLTAFGLLLVLFYVLRAFFNLLYFHLLARFSQGRFAIFANRLFSNYLKMPMAVFNNKNSSFLTKTIVSEVGGVLSIIYSTMLIFTELTVLVFIYSFLLIVNWKITLLLTVIIVIKGAFLTKTVSKKMRALGGHRAEHQKNLYEIMNATFGNIKILKFLGNNNEVEKKFKDESFSLAKIQINHQSLQPFPKIFLEFVGFSLIVLALVFFLNKYTQDIQTIIPTLSMFVLAFYRILPSITRILDSYNSVQYNKKAIDIVSAELSLEKEDLSEGDLSFNKSIKLEKITHNFQEKNVFKDIDLEILKGEKIAFIGESGSGKSTLVDIITSLLKPTSGDIFIDNVLLDKNNTLDWREKIGYIPQSIYLFDGTVAENVALNSDYSEKRVEEVLHQAKILDFLKNRDGILTKVGEGGVQLSGGQKQRIAIARALYNNPEILILDEATSALDEKVEKDIMSEIYDIAREKTLIIIAHRLSTISQCEKVYKFENGSLSLVNL